MCFGERNPVCWSIFIWESHWPLSTGWRNKIILSAVYRVSSPTPLPVLLNHAEGERGGEREGERERGRESSLAETGGFRLNHGAMKQSYPGLSVRDTLCWTNLSFHFGLDFVKSRRLSFGYSRQGMCCIPLFPPTLFFFCLQFLSFHSIFYCCSRAVTQLDFVFANTFYGLFAPAHRWGGFMTYRTVEKEPHNHNHNHNLWKTRTRSFDWRPFSPS